MQIKINVGGGVKKDATSAAVQVPASGGTASKKTLAEILGKKMGAPSTAQSPNPIKNDASLETQSAEQQSSTVHIEKQLARTEVHTQPTVTASAEPLAVEQGAEKYSAEEVAAVKRALDVLTNSLEHRDQIAESLRHCMITLQQIPHYAEALSPEDWGLMVRALREAHGVMVNTKGERREKKQKSDMMADDMMKMLNDMEI